MRAQTEKTNWVEWQLVSELSERSERNKVAVFWTEQQQQQSEKEMTSPTADAGICNAGVNGQFARPQQTPACFRHISAVVKSP